MRHLQERLRRGFANLGTSIRSEASTGLQACSSGLGSCIADIDLAAFKPALAGIGGELQIETAVVRKSAANADFWYNMRGICPAWGGKGAASVYTYG